jgi:LysR family hydrogen peroxide-inducible transcriptional activator
MPIKLTDVGKCYIDAAHKIIDADNQLQKQIASLRNESICIKIGVGPSRAPYIMPAILSEFYKTIQGVNIRIFEGSTDELNARLQNGELDLIISIPNSSTNNFTSVKLFDEKILLAVPKDNSIHSFDEAMKKYKIISPVKGQILAKVMEKINYSVSDIECHNIVTALSLVSHGIGATIVPSFICQYENDNNISLIPLPNEISSEINRTVCIFYRKEQFLSKAERLFIQAALESTTN